MDELVSVVLPIYNVEKYLAFCIDSVIEQTYQNIEIILVDDGSTDTCPQICDQYKEKDNRIKVIHKKNGGLSDARNEGLKNAKGKYICFIDSDDFIAPNYITTLYRLIKKYQTDIAVCNFKRVQDSNFPAKQDEKIEEKVYTGKEMIENIYRKSIYQQTIVTWNKMYNIDLFRNIKFPYGKQHEDEFTTHLLYYISAKVVMTSEVLYYYRYVPTSIMNQSFKMKRLDGIEALEERMKFFLEHNEEKLYHLTLIRYESVLMIHYMNCKRLLENSESIQKELYDKFKKNYKKTIKLKECSFVDKVKFTIARISPNLYYYSKKIIKGILRHE